MEKALEWWWAVSEPMVCPDSKCGEELLGCMDGVHRKEKTFKIILFNHYPTINVTY